MSATLTQWPKPKWALTIWYDSEAIFLELPTPDGKGYISKYPFTNGGLSKAMQVMKFHREECTRKGPRKVAKNDRPIIKKPLTAGTTKVQRDSVRDILRKRGII